MNLKIKDFVKLFLISLIWTSCSNSNKCFNEYPIKSEFYKPTYISVDSSMVEEKGCIYFVSTQIPLADSSFSFYGRMSFINNKFCLQLITPKSNDFVLFDMGLKDSQVKKIEITYQDQKKSFDCIYEKKIITKEQIEVRVFKVIDLYYYHHSMEFSCSLDVVFFVTRDFGIIGSYLTDIDLDGSEVMISPAGEILKDYIDYSNLELRTLE